MFSADHLADRGRRGFGSDPAVTHRGPECTVVTLDLVGVGDGMPGDGVIEGAATPNETRYFYQDLDDGGQRLNGAHRYTATFAKGQTPPVNGFWSLTLYDGHHFFAPNEIKRCSGGTKNRDLKFGVDGSLTIYVQGAPPTDDRRANWLPAPKGDFTLYVRACRPKVEIKDGTWTPPGVGTAN